MQLVFVVRDEEMFALLINGRQVLGLPTEHRGDNSTLPNAWLKNREEALTRSSRPRRVETVTKTNNYAVDRVPKGCFSFRENTKKETWKSLGSLEEKEISQGGSSVLLGAGTRGQRLKSPLRADGAPGLRW